MNKKLSRKEIVEIIHVSIRKLFEEIIQSKVEKKEFKPGISPIEINGYAVILNFIEDIEGTIIINFSNKVARLMTEKMNGFKLDEIESEEERDELIEATIGEIINMIGGRSITKFQEYNLFSNITPPTIFFGEKMKFISKSQIVYKLPYKFDENEVDVFVTVKANSKLV